MGMMKVALCLVIVAFVAQLSFAAPKKSPSSRCAAHKPEDPDHVPHGEEEQPDQEINSQPAKNCEDKMDEFCKRNVLGNEVAKCEIPFVKETCRKTCNAC